MTEIRVNFLTQIFDTNISKEISPIIVLQESGKNLYDEDKHVGKVRVASEINIYLTDEGKLYVRDHSSVKTVFVWGGQALGFSKSKRTSRYGGAKEGQISFIRKAL